MLRRPPDASEREDAAGLVIGLIVDFDVMANKGVEVEQAYGRGRVPGPRGVSRCLTFSLGREHRIS